MTLLGFSVLMAVGSGWAVPSMPPTMTGGSRMGSLPRSEDQVSLASDLPVGTVEVMVVDRVETPQRGVRVELVEVGAVSSELEGGGVYAGTTESDGKVRFAVLPSDRGRSFRAKVVLGAVRHGVSPFALDQGMGTRIRLHVFPVQDALEGLPVGAQSFTSLEVRDDDIHLGVLYQWHNWGDVTWAPRGVFLQTPAGCQGLQLPERSPDLRLVERGQKLELQGTLPPGQAGVEFSCRLPRPGGDAESFRVGLLPGVVEARVAALLPPQSGFDVEGFPAPRATRTDDGQRALITARVIDQDQQPLADQRITLRGLPTPGPARWFGVSWFAGLVLIGGWFLVKNRGVLGSGLDPGLRQKARERLLAELVAIEQARRASTIGPETYAAARAQLVDALVRLGRGKSS